MLIPRIILTFFRRDLSFEYVFSSHLPRRNEGCPTHIWSFALLTKTHRLLRNVSTNTFPRRGRMNTGNPNFSISSKSS